LLTHREGDNRSIERIWLNSDFICQPNFYYGMTAPLAGSETCSPWPKLIVFMFLSKRLIAYSFRVEDYIAETIVNNLNAVVLDQDFIRVKLGR
jgi:hypothetical protein